MKDMNTIASYICKRYEKEYGEKIDEMKLHKLMYFAQRESLILTDEPLFADEFQGWRYGPVLPGLRADYKAGNFAEVSDEDLGDDKTALDNVFAEFADSDSMTLSRLSHGEISWKRSRKGISPRENGQNPITVDDIRDDAKRMKERRSVLDQYGLL